MPWSALSPLSPPNSLGLTHGLPALLYPVLIGVSAAKIRLISLVSGKRGTPALGGKRATSASRAL